jgi:ABC-2 type transport system permease protein
MSLSWRRLRTLLVREMRATLRDPFTIGILIAAPLVALLAFGYTLSTEIKYLDLAVLDADDSPASRRLIADLGADETFVPHVVRNRDQLERMLVSGKVSAALVIPPDFDQALAEAARGGPPPQVQALYNGSDTVLAGNSEGALRMIVASTGAALVAAPAPTGGVQVVTRALFNPTLSGVPFMVSGVFGFVLSFLTTLLTAVSIVNERLTGTFDQLQVTPATSLEILLGKILPLGAVFAFDVLLMMLVGGFLLGVWPQGNPFFFWAVSAFYVLFSLMLGIIFSATSQTAAEAVQKTVLYSIPVMQLGGFAFPLRSMPIPIQWVTELFPATHYIRLSRDVYLRGEGFFGVLPDLAVLAVFGVALAALALRTIGERT